MNLFVNSLGDLVLSAGIVDIVCLSRINRIYRFFFLSGSLL